MHRLCKEVLYPGPMLKYLVCLLRAQVSMDFTKMECNLTEILNFAHNFLTFWLISWTNSSLFSLQVEWPSLLHLTENVVCSLVDHTGEIVQLGKRILR